MRGRRRSATSKARQGRLGDELDKLDGEKPSSLQRPSLKSRTLIGVPLVSHFRSMFFEGLSTIHVHFVGKRKDGGPHVSSQEWGF